MHIDNFVVFKHVFYVTAFHNMGEKVIVNHLYVLRVETIWS